MNGDPAPSGQPGNTGQQGESGATGTNGGYTTVERNECNNPPWEIEACEQSERGAWWDVSTCTCRVSPIVVDVNGNGFNLTDGVGGVDFDINGDGTKKRWSWTAAGSDDAWLSLDRNNNGLIDNGTELFGTFTPQPQSRNRNGFIALSEYDKQDNGGNNNGEIDEGDAIYASLRLWQDVNHNAISEPSELFTLPTLNVSAISLNYKESRQRDPHTNLFRYRAKVYHENRQHGGKWAYDVFLTPGR